MKHTYRFTYFILGLVISTGTIMMWTRPHGRQNSVVAKQDDDATTLKRREEEVKKHFPVADFNEAEPTDQAARVEQKAKRVRHNGLGLVNRHPDSDSGGGVFVPERQFDFPAVPIENSDAIVVGEILDAQAHLSEDKSNVYSEFTVRITTVLKSNISLPGDQIVVERLGGYVRYSDGRKLLYRIGTAGMPHVGGKYVLFITATKLNLSILTGYEFTEEGVAPLDDSRQFESFREYSESAFLSQLNDELIRAKH
jgi:hypothetical protein